MICNFAYTCTCITVHHAGKASSIYRLCITSSDFLCRLGELGNYCPVCLKINKEFVDLSGQKSHQFAIEYKGYYYR